jgi:cellulose synthase/poly-beta-1,6-N-acetylglucosamine synthase-like glycosyltransferase
MLPQTAFSPIATLLRDRRFGLLLTGALSLNVVAIALHLPGWECAFFRLTGIPCPGCGLTRACMLLLKGEVQASIKFHAFAPIFVVLIAMLITCLVLPRTTTESFINKAETLERQTGITIIILSGLILYWLARLILFPTAFAQLIRG